MPWNNQGGGGGGPWGGGGNGGGSGGGKTPWGRGSGGGPQPPDIDEIIRKGQARLRGLMPGGVGGGKGAGIIILILLIIWGVTGFYKVQPSEQGIATVFGKYTGVATNPGLHWNWPSPIGAVFRPDVTQINKLEIGFRTVGDSANRTGTTQDRPEESHMITGDQNIADLDFVVYWRIGDPADFLFNLQNPAETVKMVAESVMRDIIGQTEIQSAQTEGRASVEAQTLDKMRTLLAQYAAGVEVTKLDLLKVNPPEQVIDAFDDVQRAIQDKERLKNEAEAFRNDVVPRARGEAAKIVQEAEAYAEEVVNRSQGDANRFNSVLASYKMSKEVTTRRIYLETMEEVLGNVNKVIIDGNASGQGGVVPYLPLPEIQKRIGASGSTN